MKAKLVKTGQDYILYSESKETLAISNGRMVGRVLSPKNCESIANGYDLDGLADEHCNKLYHEGNINWDRYRIHFKLGFQKALEILGDKKFSEEDVIKAIAFGWDYEGRPKEEMIEIHNVNLEYNNSYFEDTQKYIQSLQQTEWDVEIRCYLGNGDKESDSFKDTFVTNTGTPKLDAEGCLILKRI